MKMEFNYGDFKYGDKVKDVSGKEGVIIVSHTRNNRGLIRVAFGTDGKSNWLELPPSDLRHVEPEDDIKCWDCGQPTVGGICNCQVSPTPGSELPEALKLYLAKESEPVGTAHCICSVDSNQKHGHSGLVGSIANKDIAAELVRRYNAFPGFIEKAKMFIACALEQDERLEQSQSLAELEAAIQSATK